jgi:hypothetical protein
MEGITVVKNTSKGPSVAYSRQKKYLANVTPSCSTPYKIA